VKQTYPLLAFPDKGKMLPQDLWEEVFKGLTSVEVAVICKQLSKSFYSLVQQIILSHKCCKHSSLVFFKLCNCSTKQQISLLCSQIVYQEQQSHSLRRRILQIRKVFCELTGKDVYPSENTMLQLLAQKRRSLAFCNSFYFGVVVYLLHENEDLQLKLLKILHVRFGLRHALPCPDDWKALFIELRSQLPSTANR
jgi:hypothetical protein